MKRDEFRPVVKETLARRVGMRCSNPGCRKQTSGPHADSSKATNIGVAAHITAASAGGPRHDPNLSSEQRRSIENGVWLCQNCAKLIDNDVVKYTSDRIRAWKLEAERAALEELEQSESDKSQRVRATTELIHLIENRGDKVLNEMETNCKRLSSRFERHEDYREGYAEIGVDSLEDLQTRFSDLIDSFKRLHRRHLEELECGNYVVAHDYLNSVHRVMREFERLSDPPTKWRREMDNMFNRILSTMLRMFPDFTRYTIKDMSRYPGSITTSLAQRLAPDIELFCLVKGESEKNREKARIWHPLL